MIPDTQYLTDLLMRLLRIHSPSGYTDPIVRMIGHELNSLGIDYELTRRGAIRATLPGKTRNPDRALVVHLDTLGAMVKGLKDNGRLAVTPVGTWSARFAEGARVSIFTDTTIERGTILPLKASGHTFNQEIDTQPSSWDNLEIRVDARVSNRQQLIERGFNVGDFIGIDANAEITAEGYINSRHLDDKAGVAALLTAVKCLKDSGTELPFDSHLLFTITEEVGSGASTMLHGDIAEMVSIDNATCAPGQESSEYGVTIAMADSSGPFDYHLTHHLIQLCRNNNIDYSRDIFRYYRCDSASALEAGNDIRTALIAFGVDSSHGWERCHIRSLKKTAQLIMQYLLSDPIYRDQTTLHNTLEEFPKTRLVDVSSQLQEGTDPIRQTPPDEPE